MEKGQPIETIFSESPRTPVAIDSSLEPLAAFKILVEAGVLSAPVLKGKEFIGVLELRDLIDAIVFLAKQGAKTTDKIRLEEALPSSTETPMPPGKGNHTRSMEFLQSLVSAPGTCLMPEKGQALSTAYLSRVHHFTTVRPNTPITDVLDLLTKREVRTVGIVSNEALVAMVSRSAMIRYLDDNQEATLGELRNKTVKELQLGTSPVLSLPIHSSAHEAFSMMSEQKVNGLALTDEGRAIANISASDIKLFLTFPSYELLFLPVIKFVAQIRKEEYKTRAPIAVVRPEDTLGTVIAKLSATKMHRLLVVSEDSKPVSSISLVDVLRAVVAGHKQDIQ